MRKARYDHGMAFVVMIVVLLALVFGPGLWVRRVIERYSNPPDRSNPPTRATITTR